MANKLETIIRVTKEFNLDMAHALAGYDGRCKNIHGHTYRLFVTIIGKVNKDPKSPKNGMVIDFSLLKDVIHKAIIDEFDHSLVLNSNSLHKELKNNKLGFDNILLVPYQPTCENLLIDFADRIKKLLPDYTKLLKLKLSETMTSFAEWYAIDNEQ
jgi:6-pyruvoyltetrahydropterin/6-carboxytetrahydropterin synthase